MDSFGIWAQVIQMKLQMLLVVSHYSIEIYTPRTLLMIVSIVALIANPEWLVLVHMMLHAFCQSILRYKFFISLYSVLFAVDNAVFSL